MTRAYHIPVLLQPCITNLNIKPDGVYVDLTFGGGGHSKEILNKYEDHHKISVIYQQNKGLNVTNNIALKASKAKYLWCAWTAQKPSTMRLGLPRGYQVTWILRR